MVIENVHRLMRSSGKDGILLTKAYCSLMHTEPYSTLRSIYKCIVSAVLVAFIIFLSQGTQAVGYSSINFGRMIRDAFLVQIRSPSDLLLSFDEYRERFGNLNFEEPQALYSPLHINGRDDAWAGCDDFSLLSYNDYTQLAQEKKMPGWNSMMGNPVWVAIFWEPSVSTGISYFRASVGVHDRTIDYNEVIDRESKFFTEETTRKMRDIPGYNYGHLLDSMSKNIVITLQGQADCGNGLRIFYLEGK